MALVRARSQVPLDRGFLHYDISLAPLLPDQLLEVRGGRVA